MNWQTKRDNLVPSCDNFRDFGHYDKNSRAARNKILVENNYTCRFCGGVFPKYLILSYIQRAGVSDVSCKLCYTITHLNYGLFNDIEIYYSKVSQVDIVKKTTEYIIENNDVPEPYLIDADISTVSISILEYINILNNLDSIDSTNSINELDNYKIFFTKNLNTDFVTNNYGNPFINTDINNENCQSNKINIKKHIDSQEEIDLFKKVFGKN